MILEVKSSLFFILLDIWINITRLNLLNKTNKIKGNTRNTEVFLGR